MTATDPAGIDFYRTLTQVSFTLLGLWFTVLRLAHGGWRGVVRHRFTLHIALHFFLPGMIGLASQLSEGAADGGLFWRSAAVLAGVIGFAESVTLRLPRDASEAPPGWRLRMVDPVLYLAILVVGVLPSGLTSYAPLQLVGVVTGVLFLVGLCLAWLAFAESDTPTPTPDSQTGAPGPGPIPAASTGDDVTARVDLPRMDGPGVVQRPVCRFSSGCTTSAAYAPAVRCATCPAGAAQPRFTPASRDDGPVPGRP